MDPTTANMRRPLLKRLWNAPRTATRRLSAFLHKSKVKRQSISPALLAFWREHGREWAAEEASHSDLNKLAELSARLAATPKRERAQQAEAAFQKIWNAGFSNPAEAFAWDSMKENLPPEAMLAFMEGALSARPGSARPGQKPGVGAATSSS